MKKENGWFFLTAAMTLLLMIIGTIYVFGRLHFDRSYDESSPPPSKQVSLDK